MESKRGALGWPFDTAEPRRHGHGRSNILLSRGNKAVRSSARLYYSVFFAFPPPIAGRNYERARGSTNSASTQA